MSQRYAYAYYSWSNDASYVQLSAIVMSMLCLDALRFYLLCFLFCWKLLFFIPPSLPGRRSSANGTTVAPLALDLKLILPLIFIPFVFAHVSAIVWWVLFTRFCSKLVEFSVSLVIDFFFYTCQSNENSILEHPPFRFN